MKFDIGHFDNLRERARGIQSQYPIPLFKTFQVIRDILIDIITGQERLYHQLFHQIVDVTDTDDDGKVRMPDGEKEE